jgi:hypothetical protein
MVGSVISEPPLNLTTFKNSTKSKKEFEFVAGLGRASPRVRPLKKAGHYNMTKKKQCSASE